MRLVFFWSWSGLTGLTFCGPSGARHVGWRTGLGQMAETLATLWGEERRRRWLLGLEQGIRGVGNDWGKECFHTVHKVVEIYEGLSHCKGWHTVSLSPDSDLQRRAKTFPDVCQQEGGMRRVGNPLAQCTGVDWVWAANQMARIDIKVYTESRRGSKRVEEQMKKTMCVCVCMCVCKARC